MVSTQSRELGNRGNLSAEKQRTCNTAMNSCELEGIEPGTLTWDDWWKPRRADFPDNGHWSFGSGVVVIVMAILIVPM